ncbi:MAG TPA: ABC transporter substrate-binding protein [Chloroflexota bacterium]|nr:ABC transporter substrate-binding protein [Chloroflexota bacterium]
MAEPTDPASGSAPRRSRRWLLAGLMSAGLAGVALTARGTSPFSSQAITAAGSSRVPAGRRPRIGFLSLYQRDYPDPANPWVESFRLGMRNQGYVEGKDIEILYRFADGNPDLLFAQMNELVDLPVDLLVRADTRFLNELKEKTQTLPVIMTLTVDPVGSGLAASIREPGGNFTGIRLEEPSIHGKRLELLKEVVPTITRVGLVVAERNFLAERSVREVTPLAERLGLATELVVASAGGEMPRALEQAVANGVDALYRVPDPRVAGYVRAVADAALRFHLPTVGLYREEAEAGLLVAYAANRATMFYDSARLVDRILGGASPATTPIELASRFDLFVNLATARALDLTIPRRTLLDAAGTIG